MVRFCSVAAATAIFFVLVAPTALARHDGVLLLRAVDQQTGQPLPVRMVLTDRRGRPVRVRPKDATLLADGIYFRGEVELTLKRGDYTFLVEAGPEYQTRPGRFTIDRHGQGEQTVELLRRVDLEKEGWYAGDLDLWLPLDKAALAAQARGVDLAAATVLVNQAGKCRRAKAAALPASVDRGTLPLVGPWTAVDSRRGGRLLLVGGDKLADVCAMPADGSCCVGIDAAREIGARTIAGSATDWLLPVWVATGQLDAVTIIHAADLETPGRPPQNRAYQGRSGHGRYAEAVYHHLLNCGLQIAPVGGSGAGRGNSPQPIGAARTYVWCGEECTLDDWLAGLANGRVIVSNGPLLRTRVAGEPPGHVFELAEGEVREFQIGLDLAFYEQHQVDYLEIVKNGEVIHEIRLDELARQAGRLPPVRFDASGWFLIRAVTNNADYYQYATSGAYFVESNYQKFISPESVQFFLTWLDEAAEHFVDDEAVLEDIRKARPFWEGLGKPGP